MAQDIEGLVAQYRETVKAGNRSRTIITVAVAAVLLVSVLMMYRAMQRFQTEGWNEYIAALRTEAAYLQPQFQADSLALIERVVPVYSEALEAEMAERRTELDDEVRRELTRLDGYANVRWRDMQNTIAEMAVAQEEILRQGVEDVVTPAQAQQMSELYGEVLLTRLNGLMRTELRAHADAAENIGVELSRMLDEAPPASERPPVNSQELLGVMLELSGLYLQQSL